jgi:prolyl 4-hydroxylase
MKKLSMLACRVMTLAGLAFGFQQPEGRGVTCEHPAYRVHIMSSEPLVVYIRDFLTEGERRHLLDARCVLAVNETRMVNINGDTGAYGSEGRFRHSAVADGQRGARRTSQSAYVARDDIIKCIEERALSVQGYDVPSSHLEPLQLVKYAPEEEYHFHTDWFADPAYTFSANGGNRVSSFFAYVRTCNDTTGGGTNFPLLDPPVDQRWCDIVDCDEPWDHGLTFRPVEGNAIYWENLRSDKRSGNYKTLHAGLPLNTGEKVGLNIWTRRAPLSEEARSRLTYPG